VRERVAAAACADERVSAVSSWLEMLLALAMAVTIICASSLLHHPRLVRGDDHLGNNCQRPAACVQGGWSWLVLAVATTVIFVWSILFRIPREVHGSGSPRRALTAAACVTVSQERTGHPEAQSTGRPLEGSSL
jgi:hypothetical protein